MRWAQIKLSTTRANNNNKIKSTLHTHKYQFTTTNEMVKSIGDSPTSVREESSVFLVACSVLLGIKYHNKSVQRKRINIACVPGGSDENARAHIHQFHRIQAIVGRVAAKNYISLRQKTHTFNNGYAPM